MEKVLGLDLGSVTLGIAYSDELGFVHGVETFRFTKGQYSKARERVHQLLKEKGIKVIALGLPLSLNGGNQGESIDRVNRFREDLLKEDPSLTIDLVDERFTSVMSNNLITEMGYNHNKRKEMVDRLAACEILDFYLRSKNNGH